MNGGDRGMTSAASERERGRGPVRIATAAPEAIVWHPRGARLSPAAQPTREQPVALLHGTPRRRVTTRSRRLMSPCNTATAPDGSGALLWQHRQGHGCAVPGPGAVASPRVTGKRYGAPDTSHRYQHVRWLRSFGLPHRKVLR